jgi:Uma2 family endonuclease
VCSTPQSGQSRAVMNPDTIQLGPSTSAARRITYAEWLAEYPESNQPCELWDGELVMSPAPSFYHHQIVFRFQRALHDWVAVRQLGEVVSAPIDMVLSPHRTTQPDVAFVAQARLSIVQRAIMGPADLVAEVVSLEGRTRDRIEKRDLYEQHGVKEYWIIDPEAETVEVFHLGEDQQYRLVGRSRRGEKALSELLHGFEAAVDDLLTA